MAAATGYLFSGSDRRIEPLVQTMAKYPGKFSLFDVLPIPAPFAPLLGRRGEARQFEPLLLELIAERRRADYAGSKDLLWRLVQAQDRTTSERLSDAELCDEALTLANTAVTPLRVLSWVWYLLGLHPTAERQLHAELDAVLGGRAPAFDDFAKLPFLRQIIDETMRLYPPLPVMMRTVAADDVVGGRPIPRQSIVTIAPWIIHRHRRLWDEPDRFDPDRFSPEHARGRSRYAYIPFSIGPHICTGAPLSIVQMTIAVAIWAQRFRFRLVPGHPVEPVGWTSLRPARGIKVTVESRQA
jgi:cytochrome P450